MCSGRVDLSFVLRAFVNGNDGVFIGSCYLNECHYVTDGNHLAMSMVQLGRKLLAHIGVNPKRLRMEQISAAEGSRFAEVMNDFAKEVKEFGPIGEGEGMTQDESRRKLKAVQSLVSYIKLVGRERLRVHFDTEEEYKEFFAGDEVDRLFNELIADKLAIRQITSLLGTKSLSTGEISQILGLTPPEVSRHLNSAYRHGLIGYDERGRCYTLTPGERVESLA
jgi:F420-non-reducing hydrogenase iron-sulfur subunit